MAFLTSDSWFGDWVLGLSQQCHCLSNFIAACVDFGIIFMASLSLSALTWAQWANERWKTIKACLLQRNMETEKYSMPGLVSVDHLIFSIYVNFLSLCFNHHLSSEATIAANFLYLKPLSVWPISSRAFCVCWWGCLAVWLLSFIHIRSHPAAATDVMDAASPMPLIINAFNLPRPRREFVFS